MPGQRVSLALRPPQGVFYFLGKKPKTFHPLAQGICVRGSEHISALCPEDDGCISYLLQGNKSLQNVATENDTNHLLSLPVSGAEHQPGWVVWGLSRGYSQDAAGPLSSEGWTGAGVPLLRWPVAWLASRFLLRTLSVGLLITS